MRWVLITWHEVCLPGFITARLPSQVVKKKDENIFLSSVKVTEAGSNGESHIGLAAWLLMGL